MALFDTFQQPHTPLANSAGAAPHANPYLQVLETIPAIAYSLAVTMQGDCRAVFVSPQCETLLGWSVAAYATGSDLDAPTWLDHVEPADRERVRLTLREAMLAGAPFSAEYRVITPGGERIWLRDMAAPAALHGSQLWHGIQIDISAEKTAALALHQMAYYDSLTGLPNRRLFTERLRAVLSGGDRRSIALLFLDLDRFKIINDGIGHSAGDEMLVVVAGRLAAHIAGQGSFARYGGDEFVATLEGVTQADVEALAIRLLQALRDPFNVNGYDLTVDATIGIAFADDSLLTPEELLHAADVALYRAKADGRGGYAIYDAATDLQDPDRIAREADLRRALESGEFQIAYQPVHEIATGQILAVEALLRWHHPERGLLRPAEFISLANDTGLIVPIGRWVIREACRQMRIWREQYPTFAEVQVSVNLSGRQFRQASLVADVATALQESGLPPHLLALELKEADALADSAAITETLANFQRLGVKVTIDNFGQGWTALGALSQYAIDDLKIDGSFVTRLSHQPQDIEVMRTLVEMAKTMGLDVTAGAVETSEQLAILRELGCDRAQGRHFAPPLTAVELERFLLQVAESTAPPA